MPFFDSIRIGASGTVADYTVDRSLRFNKSDLAYLGRTPSSTGNQKVWTWSCWFKRTKLADSSYFISSYGNNDGIAAIYFDNSDRINTYYDTSGANPYGAVNERRYRDVGAWMHLVWQVDALNTTQRIWINGVEESLSSSLNPPNYAYTMNQSGQLNAIGNAAWYTSGTGSNMYLAECYFSDGFKYTPSDFAETNSITGQWIPKSPSISYGTNGFYLNFSDNSGTTATTMGKDSSGNGNNFTPNNFSVSAGSGNDSVEDTPTNNFCTINPLAGYSTTFEVPSNGNLDFSLASSEFAFSSFEIPSSGKWYAEILFTTFASGRCGITNLATKNANKWHGIDHMGGAIRVDDSQVQSGLSPTIGDNKIVGIKVDRDAGTIAFTVDGSDSGTAVNISSMSSPENLVFAVGRNSSSGSAPAGSMNFGQRPFSYLPTGYKSLCSANLPDPTIKLPNKHFAAFTYTGTGSSGDVVNITNSDVDFTPDWVWVKTRDVTNDHILSDSVRGGTKYLVSSETYAEQTNTQKIRAFIQNGFESGTDGDTNWSGSRPFVAWNWNAGATDGKTYTVKVVSDSGNKYRFDDFGTSAVTLDLAEGGTYIFDQSDSSNAGHPLRFSTTSDGTHGGGTEYTTGVTTSGTPGSSGAYTQIVVAASAPTLYYYCSVHSGMGGQANTNSTLGSSNFDGSIQSTVKANQSAGFSIVSYAGNQSSAYTIGHGLGVAPNIIIAKSRTDAVNWGVYYSILGTNTNYMTLNTTDAQGANNNSEMSGVFAVLNSSTVQMSYTAFGDVGSSLIMYAFSEVAGYSKFGSYTGNGSSDGTFVYTGFRPAWVMIKRTDSSGNWFIIDNKRDTFNEVTKDLYPNTSGAETDNPAFLDFLSNGFKLKTTGASVNAGTIIYLAFAESPFKNARAR